MRNTHWVKAAATCGTVMVLTVAVGMSNPAKGTATVVSQTTEMAGISLSLDKYYADMSAEEESAPEATPSAAPAVDEATTSESGVDSSGVQVAPSPTPKSTLSQQFETTALSVASDYVNIRKTPSTDAEVLGKLYEGSSAKVLESKDGWSKIESGSVTGYIKSDFLATGAKAESLAQKYGTVYASVKPGTITLNVRSKASTSSTIVTQIPEDEQYEVLSVGDAWVKVSIDGETGYVAKEFVDMKASFKKAISIEEEQAEIRRKEEAERAAAEAAEAEREAANDSDNDGGSSNHSSNSGSSNNGSHKNSSNSGSHNTNGGGSHKNNSSSGSHKTSGNGSKHSKSNSSSHKTSGGGSSSSSKKHRSSSSHEASDSGSRGSSVASYAQKFVGNPYVWGGSSLTHGTDCSGFTMSIYRKFGRSLPHSAAAQSGCGKKVSFSNLQPGDLIFYRNGSRIGHVAIYIGGGRVCHASNKRDGIKISNYRYRTPACARRILN